MCVGVCGGVCVQCVSGECWELCVYARVRVCVGARVLELLATVAAGGGGDRGCVREISRH